jgi:hypothetical protein
MKAFRYGLFVPGSDADSAAGFDLVPEEVTARIQRGIEHPAIPGADPGTPL